MIHSIEPFPFGSREGELVVALSNTVSDTPSDIAAILQTHYRGTSLLSIWTDVSEVAGPGRGSALLAALRRRTPQAHQFDEVIVTAPVSAERWPILPTRLIVDVSEYLAGAVDDFGIWAESIATKMGRNPPASELVAIAPAPAMLEAHVLDVLDVLASASDGCTLYVDEQDLPRALAASALAQRPWTVRRIGALPPTARAGARAASPVA